MSSIAIAERPSVDAGAIEQALVGGDLSKLTPAQRVSYYNRVCDSLGLNPLTKPFAYITLNGKLTLYALKDCTEQLRASKQVSVTIAARELVDDCYVVSAKAMLPGGRCDESIGAVPLAGLKGEARANAMMKAETKAKRRVTLSICGLGMLDETEVESIPPQGYTVEAPASPALSSSPAALAARVVPNGGDSGRSVNPQDFATTENTAPAPPLPPGTVLITRVDTNLTKNKNVRKYFVTLSTGEVVTTIKEQLGALCEQLAQENRPVTVETKTTQWGVDLVAVHRVEADSHEPPGGWQGAAHGDDDEAPF